MRVPLLWEHNSWTPAIGFGRCYCEGDAWVMAPVFDAVDELSKTVSGKEKAGSLFTCAIGFVPVEEPVPSAEGGFDYPLVEQLEVSIVNVPANPDAVRLRFVGAGRSHPGCASALKALAASQAAVLAALKSAGDALKDEEEEVDENVGDESAATGELTPTTFAEGLPAHLLAGAQLAADFLEAGLEYEVLVPLAEAVGANFAADVATLQDWLLVATRRQPARRSPRTTRPTRRREGSMRLMVVRSEVRRLRREGDPVATRKALEDLLSVEVVPLYRELAEIALEDLD
ncbi:DUF2379 domain-containing protein [Corallococcus sp. ZKHCc1 1396]|uniref:DUF2379 domain-containing protein n=1 Tax=Corallococcus soli TaxID=2710757 RepID=A0ABR9PNC1_9BACT|nr:DUF2379 family protein [Corallococcus soli]MBE4749406.1 DUF2379 domain-containing protein [Corallococcus soli]